MALSHSGLKKNALIRAGYSHGKSIHKRVVDFTNPNLIQIPNWYFPHSGFTGSLWIELQPYKLERINAGGRGGTYKTNKLGPVYRFLAPMDGIQETHNHEWSEYQTIYSRLLGLESKIGTGIDQFQAAGGSIAGDISRAFSEGRFPTARDVGNSIRKAAASTDVPNKKVDSPLAYTNSPRRIFLFTFPLLSEGLKTNLVEIVKDIQAYSAPSTTEGDITINWPHLWSLQSEPRGVLDIDLAACTSVQVTWQHPYKNGIPQRCELTLGFTDVSPLFAETIRVGSLIEISENLDQNNYDEEVRKKGTLTGEIESIKNQVKTAMEKLGYPSKTSAE